ncbi:MAG TPA: PspC domain-containing protein [Candidatus Paceibacterota bacterium]|nr:PspC domain-containing protein [Candidatus Paceibacterota bacterium]HPT18325.1 PspC domain-containing protein [Candidatus Paceibacterota bacterium]
MKKTISINISGLNFIIEEEAYFKLKDYLDEIKKHCGADADIEEVMRDIEAGISEKLKSLLTPYKEVISVSDIESLIKVMGTKDDFDREVGGKVEKDNTEKRKLYRDPDDIVIAGVASGLGAYFDADPVIFRVAFVLLTFVSGFGILSYIILWIAMPEAKTANQKLEMRGEAPTVAAFEKLSKTNKNLKASFKERWNKFPILEKILSVPLLIINKLFKIIKVIFSKIVPIFKFLFGLFLIAISLFCLAFVGVGSLYLLLQNNSLYSFAFVPISFIVHSVPFIWLIITGFLSFSIPAIFFLIGGLSLIKRKSFFNFSITIILASVWLISGISFCAIGLRYLPDTIDKIDNYPAVETTSKIIDISNVNKIIVNGSYIDVFVSKEKNVETSLVGRVVDLENVNIKNEKDNLSLIWEDKKIDMCFHCDNDSVRLIIGKDNISKVKLENGAQIIK